MCLTKQTRDRKREGEVYLQKSVKDDIKVNRGQTDQYSTIFVVRTKQSINTYLTQAAAHAMLLAESCNIIIIGLVLQVILL